jgi:hypothetical protein
MTEEVATFAGRMLSARCETDGFLHPLEQFSKEYVDADDFLRVPAAGLGENVQFAVVEFPHDARRVLIVGLRGLEQREAVEALAALRFSDCQIAFLARAEPGYIGLTTSAWNDHVAASAAITQYRMAWDESIPITVAHSGEARSARITYDGQSGCYAVRVALESGSSQDIVFTATMKRGHVLVGLCIGVLMAALGCRAFFYWSEFKDTGTSLLFAVVGAMGAWMTVGMVVALFRVGAPVFTVRFEPTSICWGPPRRAPTRIAYSDISELPSDFFDASLATIRFALADGRRVVLELGNFSGEDQEQICAVLEARTGKRDQSPR